MMNDEKRFQLVSDEEIFEKAVISGDIGQVRRCVSSGVYVNRHIQDMPPLSMALVNGHFGIVDFLIHKSDVTMLDSSGKFSCIFYAIKHKCPVDLVKKIITAGFPKDGVVEYNQNRTALHLAVQCNAKSIVKGLLSLSVDVNVKDSEGLTPLHIAVIENHPGIVKLLKDASHDVECKNNLTPLLKAIHSNNLPLVKLLISQGSKLEYESKPASLKIIKPLNYAAGMGLTEIVKELLSSGAGINFATTLGDNSLHTLAFSANTYKLNEEQVTATVELLKENNINFEHVNKPGNTPLNTAVSLKNKIVAKVLVETGSNCNIRSRFDDTPLHIAARSGDHSIVSFLLNYGADVSAVNAVGLTPYDEALMQRNLQTVQAFWKFHHPYDDSGIISEKVNIQRCVSADSNRLLGKQHQWIEAILTGDLISFKCALDMGAISRGSGLQLLSPLHSAVAKHDANMVQALLESGVEIGLVNGCGETALHTAAKAGYLYICKLLLRHGACYNYSYKCRSFTPKLIAHLLYHSDIVRLLQKVEQSFFLVKQGNYRGFKVLFDKYWLNESAEVILNAVNRKGQTLLGLAIHNKSNKLVEFLMKIRLDLVKE